MLATPDEVTRPFFAPFLEVEKRILQQVEHEIRKSKPMNRVGHMSLNRVMPSTTQMDGLTKLKENMGKMYELLKSVKHKMARKVEELENKLNR